jgi:predicted DNA-binding transcriptional regulator YafY
MIRLVVLLQSGQVVDCESLSKRFKVSRRTIYRDLELIGAAGYTLSFDPGLGGYRMIGVPSIEENGNGNGNGNGKPTR